MTDTPAEREAESTWTKLRRRKVVQWGIAYVAGAWALLQGLEYLSTTFEWSRHIQQLATIGLIVGLPIVLVLAWYHGDRGEQRVRGTELLIVTLLFVVGGGLLWRFDRAREPTVEASATAAQSAAPAPAPDEKSIAVLPFADMSAEKNQEYMSDGIAEELLNLLAKVPDLKVMARTSSFAFKGQNVEIAEIAKRLKVAHVLEGSVRKSGNKVRITAQLIRAADSTHLWSEAYDRTLDDVFAVQDDIAKRVTDALKVALRLNGQLVANGKRDIEAYQLQLQARHFGQSANYPRAIEYLRKSLERDPTSAQAWADLAFIQISRADFGEVPPIEGYSAGRVSVQRAIELDPDLATAHSTMGWVHVYDLEWGSAEESTRRALALEPGNATVLLQAGWTIADLGRPTEALELIKKSIELNPLEIRGYDIQSAVQLALHKFKDAESTVRMLEALRPGEFPAAIGWMLLLQGKPAEAKVYIDKDPSELARLYALSGWYHSQGQHAESDAALERIKSQYAGDIHAFHIAELHAFRGDDDLAFEWLDRAFERRESQITDIKISFDFQRFHGDPRYKAFLKKMKLPESPTT